MGLEPGTDVPRVGQPDSTGSTRAWGLGDIALQTFFAPHNKGKWKYGFGPQFSLKTRTNEQLAGAGWGAGVAFVLVGDITPQLSSAWILGNMWSFDGNFNALLFQPMLFYNLKSMPGAYFAYNAMINADWKASSGNTWTVPLGLSFGQTFDMGGGNGLDVMIGPYYNVVRPKGAADWMIRFGITWMFP